jgi:hypothetical protein
VTTPQERYAAAFQRAAEEYHSAQPLGPDLIDVLVDTAVAVEATRQADAVRRALKDAAASQRRLHDTARPYFHMGSPCKPEYNCIVARLIDSIDPLVATRSQGSDLCKHGCLTDGLNYQECSVHGQPLKEF